MIQKKAFLVILDGWGLGQREDADAIKQADTPFVDKLYQDYPCSNLLTYGEEVGLPDGQMGNSEVGHLNLGAGRVVYQELARINKEVKENTLARNAIIQDAISYAKEKNVNFHLMGLYSDGGVHSHINHAKALIEILEEEGVENIFLHAFTDGRDTGPNSGLMYLTDLLEFLADRKTKLATVTGRYYSMDRDNRWERIKLAYDALVHGKGEQRSDLIQCIEERYAKGESDEFLHPIINSTTDAKIKEGDVVLFYNFRTDRPRQLSRVLSQEDMPEFEMNKMNLHFLTMTQYDESFENIEVIFTKDVIRNTLGEVLAKNNKTQLRIAETEKYPHVTFFFSGGREEPFEGEERILIPSPKVATYDLKPEMSAVEITDSLKEVLKEGGPDFICLNFANTDMVGHTGDFKAAQIAATTVDRCLSELVPLAIKQGYELFIIADHGNSDCMMNEDGSPHTAHTTNLVPCIYLGDSYQSIKDGKLADLAPSILKILDLEIPEEMDGEILFDENV